MIFLKLFYVFSKIGIFNFGGGYAMLSLIYSETVVKNHWLSNAEFTDIVAISQSTPGPIGINAATYVGYTSVINAGYPVWAAVLGSVLASLSIMWLSFILMISISHYLLTHKDAPWVKHVFAGTPGQSVPYFILSVALCVAVFVATLRYKVNPILALLVCGIVGLVAY